MIYKLIKCLALVLFCFSNNYIFSQDLKTTEIRVVEGLDVSFYAKNKAVPQVKNKIFLNTQLNKLNKKFDLIIAINVFNYFLNH